MMNDLYSGEKRNVLETFDLGDHPPHRKHFAFGEAEVRSPEYRITDRYTACGKCLEVCPSGAIEPGIRF